MTDQPHDVVEHQWVVMDGYIPYGVCRGHPNKSAYSPALRMNHCERVDMKLRNGQIIHVRPKSIPATARCE